MSRSDATTLAAGGDDLVGDLAASLHDAEQGAKALDQAGDGPGVAGANAQEFRRAVAGGPAVAPDGATGGQLAQADARGLAADAGSPGRVAASRLAVMARRRASGRDSSRTRWCS